MKRRKTFTYIFFGSVFFAIGFLLKTALDVEDSEGVAPELRNGPPVSLPQTEPKDDGWDLLKPPPWDTRISSRFY